MNKRSSKISGKNGNKSTVIASFKFDIHLIRNYLTLGLIDFILFLTIDINCFKLNY